MPFGPTALLSGFTWAIWHYPLVFFGGDSGETSLWYSLLCFTILVMALGVISAWLRLRSGSIWPSILLFHAFTESRLPGLSLPRFGGGGKGGIYSPPSVEYIPCFSTPPNPGRLTRQTSLREEQNVVREP
jgi:membrane protease YdiL (CAAX protease family)